MLNVIIAAKPLKVREPGHFPQACRLAVLILVALVTARAAHASADLVRANENSDMRYTSNFPEIERQQLEHDIARIASREFHIKSPELTRLMKQAKPVDGASLRAWLQERIHIFVPADYQYSTLNFDFIATTYKFPQPNLLPADNRDAKMLTQAALIGAASAVTTSSNQALEAASNLGALAYAESKAADRGLRGLKFPGVGEVVFNSPRVGLIQISGGFWENKFVTGQVDSPDNAIYRIATLFHEARHSDGNGRTQGFFHAICPSGPYKGLQACDSSLNGAYTIAAQVLKGYTEACRQCSVSAKEKLRLAFADSQVRVLKEMLIDRTHSPAELKLMIQRCDLMKTKFNNEMKDCFIYRAEFEALKNRRPPSRKMIDWDAEPEGVVPTSEPAS